MTDSQWGQLVILATTVGTFLAAEYRATRTRKWAEEDKARDVREAKEAREAATREIIERARAEAEATRIKTEAIAESLKTASLLESRAIADKLREATEATAEKIRLEAVAFREAQTEHGAKLVELVGEATAAAKEAYTEANHVNLKIEDLNQRLLSTERDPVPVIPPAVVEKIDKIDTTTTKIAERVAGDRRGIGAAPAVDTGGGKG